VHHRPSGPGPAGAACPARGTRGACRHGAGVKPLVAGGPGAWNGPQRGSALPLVLPRQSYVLVLHALVL